MYPLFYCRSHQPGSPSLSQSISRFLADMLFSVVLEMLFLVQVCSRCISLYRSKSVIQFIICGSTGEREGNRRCKRLPLWPLPSKTSLEAILVCPGMGEIGVCYVAITKSWPHLPGHVSGTHSGHWSCSESVPPGCTLCTLLLWVQVDLPRYMYPNDSSWVNPLGHKFYCWR